EMIEKVGLTGQVSQRPNELSGGQRQRVAIARALVNNPSLILADEPTGNLDQKTGGDIIRLFEELAANGQTIIIVTHDPGIAARTQRRIKIVDGLIVDGDDVDE
ncbi:MAG: ABC transporter ATP-binding protein, partial [Thermoanaerobaculia bacterium]